MSLKNAKLISVIIPTYNSESFITKTLDSVYNQTYKEFETIVIDDGSTDKTINIINNYKKLNINLLINPHSGNVGKLRNDAINNYSKGEFIAFLDSDDVWRSDKLEKQLQYTNKHKVISSNALLINSNDQTVNNKYFIDIEGNREFDTCKLLENNYVITSSVLCERKLFEQYCGFEENLGFRGEDYTLWLKITSENKILFINEELISYRVHEKNLSHYKSNERYKLLENTVKIRSRYLTHPDIEIAKAAQKGNSILYMEMARIAYKNKEYKKSLVLYKKLIQFHPFKLSKQFLKILLLYTLTYISLKAKKLR